MKKTTNRLRLNRESIRALSALDLARGGEKPFTDTTFVNTDCYTCEVTWCLCARA